jgi:hypothetical protein
MAILCNLALPTVILSMPKSSTYTILFEPTQLATARSAARSRGFQSIAAYVRALIEQDASRTQQQENLESAVAASIDRMAKELRRLHNANQALFALTDSLVRLFLTCTPEPPPESLDATKRRAKLRYDRFLLSVAQNMTGDARATLLEVLKGDTDAR